MYVLFKDINMDWLYYILLFAFIYKMSEFSPVKFYPNFYHDRAEIRKDHKGQVSGIYMFVNLLRPFKFYIGQSTNILGRMNNYLNNSFLQSKGNNSPFINALLKYGQSGFCLIILEYVDPALLNDRETFWISLLRPYYNILLGGSLNSTGFKHSQRTKDTLRRKRRGTTLSEETKSLISQSLTGSKNPFYGNIHSPVTLLAISVAKSLGFVFIYSALGVLLLSVSSVKMLAKLIQSTSTGIVSAINSALLFRGGWYLTRTPKTPLDQPLIKDQHSSEAEVVYNEMIESKSIVKAVFLFDAESREFIRRYDGVLACAKDLGIHHNAVKKLMDADGRSGKYILSAHRVLK